MIRRVAIFEYRIVCYDDREIEKEECIGEETNWGSPWTPVKVQERKEVFTDELVIWRDRMHSRLERQVEADGDTDCQDIANYLHLCEFEIRLVRIEEVEEVEKVVVVVSKEIIEAIKGYERSAKSLRETADKLRAIPELVEDFLKRAKELEDKAKELRKKYGLEGKDLE